MMPIGQGWPFLYRQLIQLLRALEMSKQQQPGYCVLVTESTGEKKIRLTEASKAEAHGFADYVNSLGDLTGRTAEVIAIYPVSLAIRSASSADCSA